MLRYVLLALMTDGRPTHGYALMKAFAGRSGVRISIGNVYRELQQLRAAGCIAAAANPAGADARRSPYVITEAGRSSLKSWLMTPAASLVREPADPLLYRLALLGDSNAEHVDAFLDEVHAELSSQSKSLERQRALMALRRSEPNGSRMLPLLLERRAKRLAADIALLEETRAVVTTMRSRKGASAARVGSAASAAPRRARRG